MEKYSIKIQTFNFNILRKITDILLSFENGNNSITISTIRLPTNLKKFTILRAPHVFKKSREQFEYRIHNFYITISIKNNNLFLKNFIIHKLLFKLNNISGISLKINKQTILK